jgi:hypothetical protein
MKRSVLVLSLLAMFSFLPVSLLAVGVGGQCDFDYSGGSMKISPVGLFGVSDSGSSSNLSIGGGLVIDSNLMGASVFNYRLKLGGDYFMNNGITEFKGASGHFLNYFGFKVYRSNRVRLWIGPMVGLRYITGKNDRGFYFGTEEHGQLGYIYDWVFINLLSSIFGNIGFHSSSEKYSLLGVDLGLTFGMNFLLTDLLVLSVEVGGKYMLLYGRRNRAIFTLFSLTSWSPDYQKARETLVGHNGDGNISVSFMFRFGEGKTAARRKR